MVTRKGLRVKGVWLKSNLAPSLSLDTVTNGPTARRTGPDQPTESLGLPDNTAQGGPGGSVTSASDSRSQHRGHGAAVGMPLVRVRCFVLIHGHPLKETGTRMSDAMSSGIGQQFPDSELHLFPDNS